MSTPHRCRTTFAAVAFAAAMLLLGLMNPNAAPGRTSCGLVCGTEGGTTAPVASFTP
ncbi:MAG: hypothetical protein GVY33_12880 [Alphaproteobacteria bacterium]|jgi:hypothetical protein|nr:hypothetical protein [Alphaproteobacteria bacterium]